MRARLSIEAYALVEGSLIQATSTGGTGCHPLAGKSRAKRGFLTETLHDFVYHVKWMGREQDPAIQIDPGALGVAPAGPQADHWGRPSLSQAQGACTGKRGGGRGVCGGHEQQRAKAPLELTQDACRTRRLFQITPLFVTLGFKAKNAALASCFLNLSERSL